VVIKSESKYDNDLKFLSRLLNQTHIKGRTEQKQNSKTVSWDSKENTQYNAAAEYWITEQICLNIHTSYIHNNILRTPPYWKHYVENMVENVTFI
jgi:hypothetical protein